MMLDMPVPTTQDAAIRMTDAARIRAATTN